MKQFVHFVAAGGIAALVNFLSRIALSLVMPYPSAIALAYALGMVTAFTLNRRFVFPAGNEHPGKQALWFSAINLIALVQTLAVSLVLARSLLPSLGIEIWREEIAHAIGIVVPMFSSYVGHRRLSFRVR